MIRLNELALPLDHPPEALRPAIVARLKLADADLVSFTVFKRSYDARKKNSEIKFVYIVDLEVGDEAAVLERFADDQHVRPAPDTAYYPVAKAPQSITERRHRFRPLRPVRRADSRANGLQTHRSGAW